MIGYAILTYVESYQVSESVLLRFFYGVTATMVSSGSGPYWALRPPYSVKAECIIVTPTLGRMIGALKLVITTLQPP